jgi:choline-sulfatase
MDSRPNILILMSDQHSPDAFGAYGNSVVETPHLDRLAARGVRFENCYCSSPICLPARMSFMTGLHVHQHGAYDNGSSPSSEIPTFAHSLAAAGYETVIAGRMHFNGVDQYHGFERRLVAECNNPIDYGPSGPRPSMTRLPLWGGVSTEQVAEYPSNPSPVLTHDDYVVERSNAFLRARDGQERPFLLVSSFYAPHPASRHREEYRAAYRRYLARDLGATELDETTFMRLHPHLRQRVAEGGAIARPPSREMNHYLLAEYYSRITYCDSLYGQILDVLEAEGLADNTIIIYLSDHGEDMGRHGYWGKMNFYDNVARVPLLLTLPGESNGKVVRENVSHVDLFPTLCELAGCTNPYDLDGDSLLPLMRGMRDGWRDTAFSAYYDMHTRRPLYMLKQGDWKFNYYCGEEAELFNLASDPDETINLASDPFYQSRRRDLLTLLRAICDPEAVETKVNRLQLMRQLTRDATMASPEKQQRDRESIINYRLERNEPWWDGNVRQSQYEQHLAWPNKN